MSTEDRVPIPDEAIEEAAVQMAGMLSGDEGQWRGYWGYAKAGLEAAAPLIVAAELERLKQMAITSNPREMVIEIARRASVLRGEGQAR